MSDPKPTITTDKHAELTNLFASLRNNHVEFLTAVANKRDPLQQTIRPAFASLIQTLTGVQKLPEPTWEVINQPPAPLSFPIPDSTDLFERACQEDAWSKSVVRNARKTTRVYWQAMLHEFPDINRASSKRKGDCSSEVDPPSKHCRLNYQEQRTTGCTLEKMPLFLQKFPTLKIDPLDSHSKGLIVTVPGVMVAVIVFKPTKEKGRPLQIRRVAMFGTDEIERTKTGLVPGSEWRTSTSHVFRGITHRASEALEFYIQSDGLCVLRNLCNWIASYSTLFERPCAYCHKCLRVSSGNSVYLPPIVRSLDDYTPYHQGCFHILRAAGLK